MPRNDLNIALQQLCHAAGVSPESDLSDRQLLDRFSSTGDEAAFAALVRRHGLLVLSACRRVLQNATDAEDAFQATFLVLARKPSSVRSETSIGPWLYGVALRLAARLKADSQRRRRHERSGLDKRATSLSDPTLREVGAALDEELTTLPASLRAPLILCYLQARTQDEAARELGWSVRTLRRRLSEGRQRLHSRLVRRGLSLPAALLTAGIAQQESSAALAHAAKTIAQEARAFASGSGLSTGGGSLKGMTLARAYLRGSVLTRFSSRFALTLVVGCMVGVSFAGLQSSEQAASRDADAVSTDADPPAPFEDPLPQGAVARFGSNHLRIGRGNVAVSGDGKTLFALSAAGVVHTYDAEAGTSIGKRVLGKRSEMDEMINAVLSEDGSTAMLAENVINGGRLTLFDAHTGVQKLKVDGTSYGVLTRDGKTLAIESHSPPAFKSIIRIYDVASGRSHDLPESAQQKIYSLRFSPDGKRVLSLRSNAKSPLSLVAADAKTGKRLWELPAATFFGFSADSRTVFVYAKGAARTFRAIEMETGAAVEAVKLPADYALQGRPVGHADGRTLLAPLRSGEIAVWDYRAGREIRRFSVFPPLEVVGPFVPIELAVSPDGRNVYANADGISGWRIADGSRLFQPPGYRGHVQAVLAIAFCAGGKELVSIAEDSRTRESQLQRWSLATGKRIGEPVADAGSEIRVTSAGIRTLRVDWARFRIRDVPFKSVNATFKIDDITTPRTPDKEWRHQLLADGKTVLNYETHRDKASITAVNYLTGEVLYEFVTAPPNGYSYFQAFSPCGRWFAAYGDVYSARSGKKLWTPSVDNSLRMDPQMPVDFSADGRYLAGFLWKEVTYFKEDGHTVWEVASGEAVCRINLSRVIRCAIGPDGRTFVCLTASGLHFIDLASGATVAEYETPDIVTYGAPAGSDVRTIVFSPDGKTLATGHYDGTIMLWKVPELPVAKLKAADFPTMWADLSSADVAKALRAADALVRAPDAAVAFLNMKLKPQAGVNIAALVRDLDSDEFAEREKAMEVLRNLGSAAEPALRDALKSASPEATRRLKSLLESFGMTTGAPVHGEGLREIRVVAVLERIHTAEAVTLLRQWANRSSESLLKTEARQALERLSLR